jgi:hypothetical protein
VGGIGGIEREQRYVKYHDLAYLDEEAILHLLEGGKMDLLITHQGPSSLQGEDHGSKLLQMLLDEGIARVWCHGHSIPNPDIVAGGPGGRTLVVPLADIAFPCKGDEPDDPGKNGWASIRFGREPKAVRERPASFREFRRYRWHELPDGRLVCPGLFR